MKKMRGILRLLSVTENCFMLKTVFILFALLMMAFPAFQGLIAWKPSLKVALNNASSEVTIVGFMVKRVEKTAS